MTVWSGYVGFGKIERGVFLCPLNWSRNSINQFQRELDLTRRPGCSTDESEAAAADRIGGQSKIDNVEDVEKLGAKLNYTQFPAASVSKRSVLDQRHVELMKAWSAKSIAPQRSKPAMIRARASRDVDRNIKK